MIEHEGNRKMVQCEDADIRRIVRGPGLAFPPGDENRGDRMLSRITVGQGIGMQLFKKNNIETCLLLCLAHGGNFEGFAVIDKSSGKRPAPGGILPVNKNNAAVIDLDDDIDRRHRVSVTGQTGAAAGTDERRSLNHENPTR